MRPPARLHWVGMQDGHLVLWRQSGKQRTEIGRVDLARGETADHEIAFRALHAKAGRRPLGICLPAAQVLRKEIVLPLAAAGSLAETVGFDLGRQTPFTASQAYYGQRVVREDLVNKRVHVLLGVVPKAGVDEIHARLTEWSAPPQAIVIDDELAGGGDCLDLLPHRLRPRSGRTGLWAGLAMAGTTLALASVLLVIPLWQKREVVIALHPVVVKAQQQAEAVDGLKREQERRLAEHAFPIEHKLAVPSRVALLDEITRILPDNTWLQQLDIRGTEVSMQGNTLASAGLIGLFEKSALIENASFKSPLVKVRGGEERFQLAAETRGGELDQALAAQRALQQPAKSGVPSRPGTRPRTTP